MLKETIDLSWFAAFAGCFSLEILNEPKIVADSPISVTVLAQSDRAYLFTKSQSMKLVEAITIRQKSLSDECTLSTFQPYIE